MGNSLGGKKKSTKIMKIDGETFKVKTPSRACDVLKNHPGLVLLESESVKHYGIRAKPLEAHQELSPKRLYFLVEVPKETVPRRVRSTINMTAKDRLESLVLSRRSASELTIMKGKSKEESNGVRVVKMRLPKKEVEKLIEGSKDEAEAAERILGLYSDKKLEFEFENNVLGLEMQGRNAGGITASDFAKARKKRVSFMPISEGCSQIAVAS